MDNKVEVKMKRPSIPNYVFLDLIGDDVKIPVSELTSGQADWLATEFRKGLDDTAKRQRQTDSTNEGSGDA